MIEYHFFTAIPPKARSMASRGNEAKTDDYATAAGTSLENRLALPLSQLNMEAYRSGHNEAVLKTVWGFPTGVRIPLPPPTKPKLNLRSI